jgi:hypothetical protein
MNVVYSVKKAKLIDILPKMADMHLEKVLKQESFFNIVDSLTLAQLLLATKQSSSRMAGPLFQQLILRFSDEKLVSIWNQVWTYKSPAGVQIILNVPEFMERLEMTPEDLFKRARETRWNDLSIRVLQRFSFAISSASLIAFVAELIERKSKTGLEKILDDEVLADRLDLPTLNRIYHRAIQAEKTRLASLLKATAARRQLNLEHPSSSIHGLI